METCFLHRKKYQPFLLLPWLCILIIYLTFPTVTWGQTFLSKERLRVFDNNHVFVGEVIGIADDKGNPMWVSLKIDNQLIVLRVFRTRLKGPPSTVAYFLDKKCEGTPFVKGPVVGGKAQMLPTALIAPPGQTIYALDHDELSTTFYPQSTLSGKGSCQTLNLLNPLKLRPTKPLIDLTKVFSPPFSLQ